MPRKGAEKKEKQVKPWDQLKECKRIFICENICVKIFLKSVWEIQFLDDKVQNN